MQSDFDILEFVVHQELPRLSLAAGETLFLKGDAARSMYVVETGTIEILMFGRPLDRIGPGSILGEMALIDADARSAAALTSEPCTLIGIDRNAFNALVTEEPRFALEVVRVMAERAERTATRLQRSRDRG